MRTMRKTENISFGQLIKCGLCEYFDFNEFKLLPESPRTVCTAVSLSKHFPVGFLIKNNPSSRKRFQFEILFICCIRSFGETWEFQVEKLSKYYFHNLSRHTRIRSNLFSIEFAHSTAKPWQAKVHEKAIDVSEKFLCLSCSIVCEIYSHIFDYRPSSLYQIFDFNAFHYNYLFHDVFLTRLP